MTFSQFRLFHANYPRQPSLAMSRNYRGDTLKLRVINIEPEQAGALLRFVAKNVKDQTVSLITKSGTDFVITTTGNVLQADFTIESAETAVLTEETTLIYDLERTLNGEVKTLQQATFLVVLDIAT